MLKDYRPVHILFHCSSNIILKLSNEYVFPFMKIMRFSRYDGCGLMQKLKSEEIGSIMTKRGEKIRVITVACNRRRRSEWLVSSCGACIEAVVNKWRVCGSWFYIFLLCTRFLGFERRKIVLSFLLSLSSFLLPHLSSFLYNVYAVLTLLNKY